MSKTLGMLNNQQAVINARVIPRRVPCSKCPYSPQDLTFWPIYRLYQNDSKVPQTILLTLFLTVHNSMFLRRLDLCLVLPSTSPVLSQQNHGLRAVSHSL